MSEETIILYFPETDEDLELDVEFEYQPEEKEVRFYSDHSGSPYFPEQVDVYSVRHGKRELIKELTLKQIEEIEDLILEKLNDWEPDFD